MADRPWWQIVARWFVFLAVVGGSIWFLANYRQSGQVEGEKISIQTPHLADKVLKVIPPQWRLQTEKQISHLLDKQKEITKEEPWMQDIQSRVNQASQQISQFPQQSKKEIKKKLIRSACDELLREVDNE